MRPLAAVILLTLSACPCRGSSIVGWRTDTTGCYPNADPPVKWSAEENVAWKTKLPGRSPSSPIIVGDRIFTTADPTWLLCVDKKTGKVLWEQEHGSGTKTQKYVGNACCTPVSDGKTVFMLFNNGIGAAYDIGGSRKWSRTIKAKAKGYGQSMSPALAGGVVGLHIDDDFFGIDLETGKERWKGTEVQHQGSPVAIRVRNLWVFLGTHGTVWRASDGQVLAKIGFPALNMFTTPSVADGTATWISEGKFLVRATFEAKGKDEVQIQKSHVGIPRGLHYGSVLVHDGLVYIWDTVEYKAKEKVLRVVDLEAKGKVVCEKALAGSWGYPSPCWAGKYLYVSHDNGCTWVFEPRRDKGEVLLRDVARNELEPFGSSPVFEANRMYIRGMQHLYAIENPAGKPAPAAPAAPAAGAKPVPPPPPSPVVAKVQAVAVKHCPGASWAQQRGSNRVFITVPGGGGRIAVGGTPLVLGIVLPAGGQPGYVYLTQARDLPVGTVEELPLKKDLDALFGSAGLTSPQAKNAVRWMVEK